MSITVAQSVAMSNQGYVSQNRDRADKNLQKTGADLQAFSADSFVSSGRKESKPLFSKSLLSELTSTNHQKTGTALFGSLIGIGAFMAMGALGGSPAAAAAVAVGIPSGIWIGKSMNDAGPREGMAKELTTMNESKMGTAIGGALAGTGVMMAVGSLTGNPMLAVASGAGAMAAAWIGKSYKDMKAHAA